MKSIQKRLIALLLTLVMLTGALMTPALAWDEAEDSLYQSLGTTLGLSTARLKNMETIYNYLTEEMGLNTAAACGLLANMYKESSFDPTVGSTICLGIVQWYNTHYYGLLAYCDLCGYDPESLSGQLAFLKHQLTAGDYTKVYDYLLNVEDSAAGAYDAGWYFCYYFERPASYSTASVTRGNLARDTFYAFYQEIENLWPFEDVATTSWYYNTIYYAYRNGLVSGTSATTFSPGDVMTRSQVVQVLHNMNDNPTPLMIAPYTDTEATKWYYKAVNWAWSTGIVSGTSATTFSPNMELTREQMVKILYNYYVNFLGYEAENLDLLENYPDAASLSYGLTAMEWAVGNGIISGVKGDDGVVELQPKKSCTRAEGVAMLVRFVQFVESSC